MCRKEVSEDVPKGKSITGMKTGRKEAGKTGITDTLAWKKTKTR